MNNISSAKYSGTSFINAIPLKALRWVETINLRSEFKALKNMHSEDLWWIVAERDPEGPMPLNDVLQRMVENETPVMLVHISEANLDPTPWSAIQYKPCCSTPLSSICCSIIFWTVTVFLSWLTVSCLAPAESRTLFQVSYWALLLALGVFLCSPQTNAEAFLSRITSWFAKG